MASQSPETLIPANAFAELPTTLRSELLDAFSKIVQNYAEHKWEPAELNGGKLCEVVYSIVRGRVDGQYSSRASKPKNIVDACKEVEKTSSIPRSLKVQIPRMILALYEVRNNRNVGHVGGEVDPNHMDAVCVLQMSKWLMAELVRILHNRPIDEASELVDALVERETPLIWKVGGKTRVLDPNIGMKDKALLLLHASAGPLKERQLVDFLDYSNGSVFRRDILRPAHKKRLIEYDQSSGSVTISPSGIERAEQLIAERT
jgi:hypothetical protein